MECQSISKVYNLGKEKIIAVDQSSDNKDKTCLCFVECKDAEITIKDIKYIEEQEDIDKYINKNLAKIYGAFGLSNLD